MGSSNSHTQLKILTAVYDYGPHVMDVVASLYKNFSMPDSVARCAIGREYNKGLLRRLVRGSYQLTDKGNKVLDERLEDSSFANQLVKGSKSPASEAAGFFGEKKPKKHKPKVRRAKSKKRMKRGQAQLVALQAIKAFGYRDAFTGYLMARKGMTKSAVSSALNRALREGFAYRSNNNRDYLKLTHDGVGRLEILKSRFQDQGERAEEMRSEPPAPYHVPEPTEEPVTVKPAITSGSEAVISKVTGLVDRNNELQDELQYVRDELRAIQKRIEEFLGSK